MKKMANETNEATVHTMTYPDCETDDSAIPPLDSSSAIMPSNRSRIVKMTGSYAHKKGSSNIRPVNGNSIIVALSSISLVLGNSPKTVKGARRIAATISVPSQK